MAAVVGCVVELDFAKFWRGVPQKAIRIPSPLSVPTKNISEAPCICFLNPAHLPISQLVLPRDHFCDQQLRFTHLQGTGEHSECKIGGFERQSAVFLTCAETTATSRFRSLSAHSGVSNKKSSYCTLTEHARWCWRGTAAACWGVRVNCQYQWDRFKEIPGLFCSEAAILFTTLFGVQKLPLSPSSPLRCKYAQRYSTKDPVTYCVACVRGTA